ncbi:hypothetical protein HDZ31DRAFT_69195 [Schizophyllum fasciatum]
MSGCMPRPGHSLSPPLRTSSPPLLGSSPPLLESSPPTHNSSSPPAHSCSPLAARLPRSKLSRSALTHRERNSSLQDTSLSEETKVDADVAAGQPTTSGPSTLQTPNAKPSVAQEARRASAASQRTGAFNISPWVMSYEAHGRQLPSSSPPSSPSPHLGASPASPLSTASRPALLSSVSPPLPASRPSSASPASSHRSVAALLKDMLSTPKKTPVRDVSTLFTPGSSSVAGGDEGFMGGTSLNGDPGCVAGGESGCDLGSGSGSGSGSGGVSGPGSISSRARGTARRPRGRTPGLPKHLANLPPSTRVLRSMSPAVGTLPDRGPGMVGQAAAAPAGGMMAAVRRTTAPPQGIAARLRSSGATVAPLQETEVPWETVTPVRTSAARGTSSARLQLPMRVPLTEGRQRNVAGRSEGLALGEDGSRRPSPARRVEPAKQNVPVTAAAAIYPTASSVSALATPALASSTSPNKLASLKMDVEAGSLTVAPVEPVRTDMSIPAIASASAHSMFHRQGRRFIPLDDSDEDIEE